MMDTVIHSAGHSSPAADTQPPDAFVLMRKNPSKPRGNSAETQPPDDPVIPEMVLTAPAATAVPDVFLPDESDGAIGPTKPAPDCFPAQLFLKVQLLSTTADKFKNVWKQKRCLRCYSDKYRARQCPHFTTPTTTPCHYCWYLYHDTTACPYYDQNEKICPSSLDRST